MGRKALLQSEEASLSRAVIHLVNPLWAAAGSEWRTVELYRLLCEHAGVKVWSAYDAHPQMRALLPIERIAPARLCFPRGGTLVFVGVYYRYGRWVHLSGAARRIIVYNSPHPHILRRRVRKLRSFGRKKVEVAFASRWLREESGLDGPVQISPVDLHRFAPRARPRAGGPFTVGRLSRSQPEKHNARDPALYRRLVEEGMAVRVMGGECLRDKGPLDPRVQVLPEGAEDPVRFLTGLDCFFYRTEDGWREPHGRVVQEAMACGLPVLCGRSGGMAEYIVHGENGFLFESDGEAVEILESLRRRPELSERVGRAARATMERVFSPEALSALVDFYLRPAVSGPGADGAASPEKRRPDFLRSERSAGEGSS